ncbi:unnamed protein product [Cunninghamella blakesleeana]
MRFFNISSQGTATVTATSTSTFKQKALVGSTFGICVGFAALGSFFGYNGKTVSQYMASSAVSIAALLGAQQLLNAKEPFPALLYQSSASHANTPLQHLRLLNNAPPSMSIQSNSPLFVHIHNNT